MEKEEISLEAQFKNKISSITEELKDFYDGISELEQLLDLYELKIMALHEPVIIPQIGFLGKYDFDEDENLVVLSEGTLRLKNLKSDGIAKAEISIDVEGGKFSLLQKKIFLPPYDEEEIEEFYEKNKEGWDYYIPVVEVRVEKNKVLEDSSSSEEEE